MTLSSSWRHRVGAAPRRTTCVTISVRVEPLLAVVSADARRSTRPIPRDVLGLHQGSWYRGTLVHHYRDDRGEWRAVVRYSTGVMENRAKGCPFTELRPIHDGRRQIAATMAAVDLEADDVDQPLTCYSSHSLPAIWVRPDPPGEEISAGHAQPRAAPCAGCSVRACRSSSPGSAGSKRWAAFSKRYLREHPQCESTDCALWPPWERPLATEVDHIDGCGRTGARAFDESNCMAMCKPYHSRKTVKHDGGFGRPIDRQ